jgi:hypothetical protein
MVSQMNWPALKSKRATAGVRSVTSQVRSPSSLT